MIIWNNPEERLPEVDEDDVTNLKGGFSKNLFIQYEWDNKTLSEHGTHHGIGFYCLRSGTWSIRDVRGDYVVTGWTEINKTNLEMFQIIQLVEVVKNWLKGIKRG